MTTLTVNGDRLETETFRILELHADFDCGNCGQCCFNSWQLPLSRQRLPRLRAALSAAGQTDAQIDAEIQPYPKNENPLTAGCVGKNSAGDCVFAGGQSGSSLCTIQHQCGHGELPDICQSYPRMALATPAGVYLTLTNACPTVARLLLRENALRETAPRSVFSHAPSLVGVTLGEGASVPEWTAGLRPDWHAYDYFWRWAVEFVARPGLTPAQALYSLGIAIGAIEQHAAVLTRLDELAAMLESVGNNPDEIFARQCLPIQPCTELGILYFDAMLKQASATRSIDSWVQSLGDPFKRDEADRRRLAGEFDKRIRPNLREFERIERNYAASRLYANPFCYRTDRLRTGYFVNALMLTSLRFAMLKLCLEKNRPLDEEICLAAAGLSDSLMLHSETMQSVFVDKLTANIDTDLKNLMRLTLF